MIRFEIGNQICVCLSENEISLELNQSLHHSIPVNPNEYAILSTIAKYGSLNTPISQRLIESKITQQYKMTLPENGFKNAVAALRKKFRKLTEEHVTTKKILSKIFTGPDTSSLLLCKTTIRMASTINTRSISTQQTALAKPFVFVCVIKRSIQIRCGSS